MTKIIRVGESSFVPEVKKKPIQFLYRFDVGRCFGSPYVSCETSSTSEHGLLTERPSSYKYIELISQNYCGSERSLMFAYNDPSDRRFGKLYLGYWNDGVAE
jgi:hypothetical protein